MTWGFAFSELLPQWGVSWLSALQLMEVGVVRWGGWYPGAHSWLCPMGLREARCDLIFFTVLSLVLLGCRGGSLSSPHQNGV